MMPDQTPVSSPASPSPNAGPNAGSWRGRASIGVALAAALVLAVPLSSAITPLFATPVPEASEACRAAADAVVAARGVSPDGTQVDGTGIEMRIGQMLLVGLEGLAPDQGTVPRTRELIATGQLGGVLLLRRNMGDRDQTRALIAYLKPDGAALPPFIAIDQEGGRVQRLSREQGVVPIPSAARVGRMPAAQASSTYRLMARELAGFGVNVNFGPVVDLAIDPDNPVIARLERSYGRDPSLVSDAASAFIDAHRAHGIVTAIKHFPGHGSSSADSHLGFTDVTRTWSEVELKPFRTLAPRADMVMTSHVYHTEYAGEGDYPASLSDVAVDWLLRSDIGYDGVIVTDDLNMGAITDSYSFEETVLRGVLAGNDVIMFSTPLHEGEHVAIAARDVLCRAIARGDLDYARIERSYERVRDLKAGRLLGL